MRTLAVLTLVFALSGPFRFAQSADGNWSITVSMKEGAVEGAATLKQVGNEVSGTLGPVGDPTIAVTGVMTGTKLTLELRPRPGRSTLFDRCHLTVGEGEMNGTIEQKGSPIGTIKFVKAK